MNKRIAQLQKEIDIERDRIKNCKHCWGESFYNPEKQLKPYGYKLVKQGSDIWSEPEGYEEKEVPRWSRECTICGFEEHTYRQKPVISNFEPEFSED